MHFWALVLLAMLVLLVLLARKSLSCRTSWVGQRLAKARVEGSNPFSRSTFSANRLNLRGLCLFGRLVQGVEQVLVEAAAWADNIGETENAPTRGMDLTEFA